MPQLIEHIDAIGRKKNRDVLMVKVIPVDYGPSDKELSPFEEFSRLFDYESNTFRSEFINWLDKVGIVYLECLGFATDYDISSYTGDLYLDVPFDLEHLQYKLLESHLENSDGSNRIPGIYFCYCPLEDSLENSHHDELGYWKSVADRL